jgi:hypothetical protein
MTPELNVAHRFDGQRSIGKNRSSVLISNLRSGTLSIVMHRSVTASHRADQRPVVSLPLTGPSVTCTGDLGRGQPQLSKLG